MSEPDVVVGFESDQRVFRPGEILSGHYRVDGINPAQLTALELSVLWHTEGKGDEDLAVHLFQRFLADEAGRLDGPETVDAVRRSVAPLLGERGASLDDGRGEADAVFPLPAGARIDTLLLGCTHYPLLVDVIAQAVGPEVAVIDSASATASALASLLEVHGMATAAASPSHLQLTTGDVGAFRRTAQLLFGELFPSVEPVTVRPIPPGEAAA